MPRPPAGEGFVLRKGRYIPVSSRLVPAGLGPTGINDRGQIVGEYVDSRDVSRGFLLEPDGRFTRINVPGSKATNATKINSRGQIVGLYNDKSEDLGDQADSVPPFTLRGFLLDRGRFTRIDVRGATSTQVLDINDRGQAVGEYQDSDGTYHGFLWDRGRITTIDVPRAATTGATGINNRGQILGGFSDECGRFHGFVLDRGRYTTFDAPGTTPIVPLGINDRGKVVGYFITDPATGTVSGFTFDRGRFSVIDRPGFDVTALFDINNRGQSVGVALFLPPARSRDAAADELQRHFR